MAEPMATALKMRAEAVSHKRQARAHQRAARAKMDELARFCAQHGIELIVVTGKGMNDGNGEEDSSN